MSDFCIKPDVQQKHGAGLVFTCGQNDVGQLGLGIDIDERSRPTAVKELNNILDISAGGMHTLCIDRDGKVYSWGCNDDCALGRETPNEDDAASPGLVSIDEKVVQITAGDSHSAALTESGKVFAWGSFRDSHGVMGLTPKGKQIAPTPIMTNAAKIASGADHLLILASNGALYSLGCAEQGQLGRISSRFADRGSRRGLGNLLNPGLINFHSTTKFDDIWTGSYNSFAKEHFSGKIFSFGLNNYKQLGLSEFEVYNWPVITPTFTLDRQWIAICGGQHHTLALDIKGLTYVLGRKEYGRLGLGKNCDDANEPTIILALQDKKVINISCGSCVSFAVTDEGTAYSWGMGTNCQLGNGSDEDVYEPTPISGAQIKDKKVIKVSSGGQHTVFLTQDNS